MSTKPPSGTRDFLPEDIRRREHVMRVVRDVYESYGFEPLETPAFENIETLLGKYGEEGNQLIFKILRRGEHEASGQADLALRYDLTVPLARVVAQYQNDLPRFFKRYQIQPVWRADRPAKGRYREFYQCDIDALGSTSPMVEAELIGAVSEVLGRLGFDNYVIRLNHRKALTALLESAGVPVPLHGEALTAVDKLDKVGVEGVEKEFVARGIDAEAGRKCLSYFSESSGDTTPEAGLERFRAFIGGHESGIAAADNLAAIVRLASGGPGRGRVRLDASLARGLSYYTDAIMEIAVPDLTGSMAGGGRYDNLVGMFLGRDIPACGFSLGLERIIGVMAEGNLGHAMFGGEGIENAAPQDAADDVVSAFVAGQDAIGDRAAHAARVVGEDAEGDVDVLLLGQALALRRHGGGIGLAGQRGDFHEERGEDVRSVV